MIALSLGRKGQAIIITKGQAVIITKGQAIIITKGQAIIITKKQAIIITKGQAIIIIKGQAMALLLLIIVGVAAGECFEEERGGCLEEKPRQCLEDLLDIGGGRECWEGEEAGMALRAWVLAEGGGERQEVDITLLRCVLSVK